MGDNRDQATAESAFFRVPPAEVRVSILTAAFGGRTMHVRRWQPATTQPRTKGGKWSMARGSTRQWLGEAFATIKSKRKRQEALPAEREKQWFGCIYCHVPDPWTAVSTSPAADTCLTNLKESQHKGREGHRSCIRPFDIPPELAVGAMGWLLTCRKAYNEGVEVLYASNTFHIRTKA